LHPKGSQSWLALQRTAPIRWARGLPFWDIRLQRQMPPGKNAIYQCNAGNPSLDLSWSCPLPQPFGPPAPPKPCPYPTSCGLAFSSSFVHPNTSKRAMRISGRSFSRLSTSLFATNNTARRPPPSYSSTKWSQSDFISLSRRMASRGEPYGLAEPATHTLVCRKTSGSPPGTQEAPPHIPLHTFYDDAGRSCAISTVHKCVEDERVQADLGFVAAVQNRKVIRVLGACRSGWR
jgi:hypothetical protein